MAIESKDVKKQEASHASAAERTSTRKVFVPAVDIIEAKDAIVLIADVPGADEKSVDITLEKNVLAITAHVEPTEHKDFQAASAEYETGDYQRSFTISDAIDQENIGATVRKGVLRITLPKAAQAKTKKIVVAAA